MLNKGFQRAIVWTVAVGLGLVFLCSLPALFQGGWWLLAIPALLGLALLLWHGLKRLSPRACTILFFVSLAVWVGVLLFLGRALRLEHNWDFGRVYEGAVDLSQNGRFTWAEAYYWESPNNLPVTLVLAVWFRLTGMFGLHPMTAGILLNVLALAASVALLFCTVRRVFGAGKALFCCVLCYFFTPMVLYVPVFYTDTLSMPFVCFLLLAGAMAQTAKKTSARVWWGVGAGLAAGVGYLIKATVLIMALALLMGALLRYKKQALALCGGLCILAAAVLGGWQLWFSQTNLVDPEQVQAHRLPASHYIMMGLAGEGGYNEEDHFFSAEFEDVESRQKANREVIADRLEAYGPVGLAQHLQRKIAYTWGDGTYFAPRKLALYPVYQTPLHQWVLPDGQYYPIYFGIAQACQALLLLLLFGGALAQAVKRRPKIDLVWAGRLAAFGLALFLLMWETRSRYLVNFAPVLVLAAAFGLLELYGACSKAFHKVKRISYKERP